MVETRSKSRLRKKPALEENGSSKEPSSSSSKIITKASSSSTLQKFIILLLIVLTAGALYYLTTLPPTTTTINQGADSRDAILLVLAYGWMTAVSTGLGVVPFLFTTQKLSQYWLGIANAVAAGMMLTASGTLAYEGFHVEDDRNQGNLPICLGINCAYRMVGGFLLGVVFIIFIKWMLDDDDIGVFELQGAEAKRALLVMAVMTLHSFAEGVAIGVAFSGEKGHTLGTFISLSLAIHNVPEGLAVAVVLIPRGVSLLSTAGWSIFSSLPQPLVAIPVFIFVSAAIPWLPVGLGFASGAMLYVALFELLPEASQLINLSTTLALTIISSGAMLCLQKLAECNVP
jgi:zinc transporter, ZIP family